MVCLLVLMPLPPAISAAPFSQSWTFTGPYGGSNTWHGSWSWTGSWQRPSWTGTWTWRTWSAPTYPYSTWTTQYYPAYYNRMIMPAISAPGGRVSVEGSGFLPTDNTCTISSPSSSNLILAGTAACVIQVGTGNAVGGFIVGNVLPGYYVVQITGTQGDFAQAIITIE